MKADHRLLDSSLAHHRNLGGRRSGVSVVGAAMVAGGLSVAVDASVAAAGGSVEVGARDVHAGSVVAGSVMVDSASRSSPLHPTAAMMASALAATIPE